MSETSFDPAPYLTRIGKKDYLPVAARLQWLDAETERYTIDTELVAVTETSAIARAIVTTFNQDGQVLRRGTDYKTENVEGFGDFVEKAVTGAIGRALAQLGYGTQFAAELGDEAVPAGGGAGGRQPARGAAGQMGWNEFWPEARKLGYKDKAAVEAAIGRSIDGLLPPDVHGLIQQIASSGKAVAAGPVPSAETPPPSQPRDSRDPNQTEMPMSDPVTGDEAALIRFGERAQAGGDWPVLLDEAGDRDEYLAELATHAPTLGHLDILVERSKKLGKYTVRVSKADRDTRRRLQARLAALTR